MNQSNTNRVVFVTGVSGSGKSTIGQRLADQWQATFADADDFHPVANRAKMATGTPLTDADRAPWLATMRSFIVTQLQDANLVVALSLIHI